MMFSELCKIMVNKVIFLGFMGAIAPPLDPAPVSVSCNTFVLLCVFRHIANTLAPLPSQYRNVKEFNLHTVTDLLLRQMRCS